MNDPTDERQRIELYDKYSYRGKVVGGKERTKIAEGWFHGWGQGDLSDAGTSLAIVELDDGTVETWEPSKTRLLPMMTAYVERGNKWQRIRLREIAKGDYFKRFENDKPIVTSTGVSVFLALKDAYYLHEESRWMVDAKLVGRVPDESIKVR